MNNPTWRKLNQFFASSGIGKIQDAFGNYLPDGDIDTLESCEIEMNLEIERGEQRNCNKEDIIGQPVRKRRRQFRLTFTDPDPQTMFKYFAWMQGAVTAPTGTVANEVQTLTRSGDVTGGTFPLSLSNYEGRSGTTKQIPYNATAAQIQAAIVDQAHTLGKIIKPGDVVVSGNWGTGIVITFGKRLRNANLLSLVVGNGAITGGGTIVNTQTTAGGNKYHTAQRSADGSKPHTTFAMGDKTGSVATKKYGDAVVSNIDINATNQQTSPEMIVTIDCNFIPSEITEFDVPQCVNKPSVKTEDIRLKFDGIFENRDLVSDSASFNDNVPTGAAHAFDEMDITRPFVRGNQPSQEFQSEIFGNSEHNLYVLAENEFVEGNEIETVRHYGNPGNRFTVIAPETKIKPQNQLEGFSGEADESTIKITGTPYAITDLPVTFEYVGDQSVAFLQS